MSIDVPDGATGDEAAGFRARLWAAADDRQWGSSDMSPADYWEGPSVPNGGLEPIDDLPGGIELPDGWSANNDETEEDEA